MPAPRKEFQHAKHNRKLPDIENSQCDAPARNDPSRRHGRHAAQIWRCSGSIVLVRRDPGPNAERCQPLKVQSHGHWDGTGSCRLPEILLFGFLRDLSLTYSC